MNKTPREAKWSWAPDAGDGSRLAILALRMPYSLMAKRNATVLAVPSCIYATSASFGRFGLQALANWQAFSSISRRACGAVAGATLVPRARSSGVQSRSLDLSP